MKLMTLSLCVFCGTLLGSLSAKAEDTTAPATVTVNGSTYSLDPNAIVATMVHGKGNKDFAVTIRGSGLYGFSVHGYGVGFPTYGIIADTASGGADGDFTLRLHFNDSYLMPDGDKPKTYSGYIPIHIFQGSETCFDTNYLNLSVTLTVYPAPSAIAPAQQPKKQ